MSKSASSTGDINNAMFKLRRQLAPLKAIHPIDWQALQVAETAEYMRILRYLFTEYSSEFTDRINQSLQFSSPMDSKSDDDFVAAIYSIARAEFDYRIVISKDKFLANYFGSEIKAHIVSDLARMIQHKFRAQHSTGTEAGDDGSSRFMSVSQQDVSTLAVISEIQASQQELRAMSSQAISLWLAFKSQAEKAEKELVEVRRSSEIKDVQIKQLTLRVERLEELFAANRTDPYYDDEYS